MPILKKCKQCGAACSITPARENTFKFCSYACRGLWRKQNFKGEGNPAWQGGSREKKCQGCGLTIIWSGEPFSTFKKRKFCTKKCADLHGFRYKGESHPNYRKDARRKNRSGPHKKWRDSVLARDNFICRHCGAKGIELHAHHIKPYKSYPSLRFDIDNGLTLCYVCHWREHSAQNENGVNSGEPAARKGGGNPEPSHRGNLVEGVTTNGRAFKRWVGKCDFCGKKISKPLSEIKGKKWLCCSHSCSSKQRIKLHGPIKKGSKADTSAPAVKA